MPVRAPELTPSLLQVDAILRRLTGTSALSEVARFLKAQFSHYRWVGAFRREPKGLTLVGWDGDDPAGGQSSPLEGTARGAAVQAGTTILVAEVHDAAREQPGWAGARSLIAVPVRDGPETIGVLEVDAVVEAAFDATDRRFLETVAGKLGPAMRSAVPGGTPAPSPRAPP